MPDGSRSNSWLIFRYNKFSKVIEKKLAKYNRLEAYLNVNFTIPLHKNINMHIR